MEEPKNVLEKIEQLRSEGVSPDEIERALLNGELGEIKTLPDGHQVIACSMKESNKSEIELHIIEEWNRPERIAHFAVPSLKKFLSDWRNYGNWSVLPKCDMCGKLYVPYHVNDEDWGELNGWLCPICFGDITGKMEAHMVASRSLFEVPDDSVQLSGYIAEILEPGVKASSEVIYNMLEIVFDEDVREIMEKAEVLSQKNGQLKVDGSRLPTISTDMLEKFKQLRNEEKSQGEIERMLAGEIIVHEESNSTVKADSPVPLLKKFLLDWDKYGNWSVLPRCDICGVLYQHFYVSDEDWEEIDGWLCPECHMEVMGKKLGPMTTFWGNLFEIIMDSTMLTADLKRVLKPRTKPSIKAAYSVIQAMYGWDTKRIMKKAKFVTQKNGQFTFDDSRLPWPVDLLRRAR